MYQLLKSRDLDVNTCAARFDKQREIDRLSFTRTRCVRKCCAQRAVGCGCSTTCLTAASRTIRADAQGIEHELAEAGSDLSQQWRKAISLDDKPDALRVLRFILSEEGSDGVPRDLVAPEFLGEGRNVSQAECDAAV